MKRTILAYLENMAHFQVCFVLKIENITREICRCYWIIIFRIPKSEHICNVRCVTMCRLIVGVLISYLFHVPFYGTMHFSHRISIRQYCFKYNFIYQFVCEFVFGWLYGWNGLRILS